MSTLENRNRPLREGEVYLFHESDPRCPAEGSLWGRVARVTGSKIYLEAWTRDHVRMEHWQYLPADCRFCRLSSREELAVFSAEEMYVDCMLHRMCTV